MKCNKCEKEIDSCTSCHNHLDIGDELICYELEHYCDKECLII